MGNYLDTDGVAYLAGKMDECFARQDIVADPFEESTTYAIGDYCMHNGTLYKAVAEHTGAWTDADFEAVPVGGELEAVNAETAEAQEITQTVSGNKMGALIDTASGSIASFYPDSTIPTVRGLTVNIEPVQDLHGYDSPWPAGGGKNLFNYENTGITLASMGQTGPVFSNTNTDSRTFFNFQFRALNNGTVVVTSDAQSISSTGRKSATITISETITHVSIVHNGSQRNLSVIYPFTGQGTFTISFDVTAYNPSSVGGLSFKDVQIESGSTATAYAPYSNICPISGWDAVEVDRTGVNLLNPNFDDYSQTNGYSYILNVVPKNLSARFTFTDKDTSIDVSGCYIGFIGETPVSNVAPINYRWAVLNGAIQPNVSNLSGNGVLCGNVFIYPKTKEAFDKLFARWNIMVELGSTATAYKPYSGDTYTIQLGQTVYGGTLDVTGGKMVVDRIAIDPTQWTRYNAGNGYVAYRITDLPEGVSSTDSGNYPMSNLIPKFGSFSSSNMTENIIQTPRKGTNTVYMALQEGIDPTSAQFSYKIAEPITVNLTPLEISVLTGQTNNVWADSGDVSVEYAADLKTYIDQKIAAAASSPIVGTATVGTAVVE